MLGLIQSVEETARTHPDSTAYVFEDTQVSYREFVEKFHRAAGALEANGIRKGDHVALILGNSPAFLVAYYAIMKQGAIAIPINPTYTPDEIGYILMNGDVKGILGIAPLVEAAKDRLVHLPNLKIVVSVPYADQEGPNETHQQVTFITLDRWLEIEHPLTEVTNELDDIAVILYTSGTTGKPKGAMLSHRNLTSNARSIGDYLHVSSSDRTLAVLPMFHVFCLTVVVNASLAHGASIIIASRFSPQETFELAKKEQVTIFAGVPTMYNFLLQTVKAHPEYATYFESTRLFVSGGASLPVPLLEAFDRTFQCRILEGYGLSEASPVTCFNPVNGVQKPGSIGTSIVDVENKVVDELGQELPDGQVGELIVRGPNVMTGYYKMPEESQATLRDGWLYTGDLARRDEDGYFYIVDRKKDMIIVGGYNVYPREVEEVLYQHPNIIEAAVIGIPDEEMGEAVKAFVVARETMTEEETRTFCATSLAKYKCPTQIEFIDQLPRNTTGKILRTVLKKQPTNS
ncbi:fatty acid--CoA ligase family protein [Exiguobacterium sp. s143]|uniref:fatty acid--CoA ligase family protein n=1 Tax=Exiguobacterium sp. s143 TaxID=2751201 RepID=UPI001BED37F4|nr:fatty acid--CoA ligase family protein [Exiguobacterium sp. s143]